MAALSTARLAHSLRAAGAQVRAPRPGAWRAVARQVCREAELGYARASPLAARTPLLGVARHFAEQRRGAASGPTRQAEALDFGSAQAAFDSKTTLELLRTWLVFKTCSVGWIVKHCETLYKMSLKLLGANLTHFAMRHAIFNHFCAGETSTEIIPRMQRLQQYGVGGILDYAAEAKDESPPNAEKAAEGDVGAPLSAKTFEYKGEAVCDANAEIFLDAIRAVRDATPDGFAAIKLTGLGDPLLLERMSTCLVETTELFRRISEGGDGQGAPRQSYYCIDRSFNLDFETFSTGWRKLFRVKDDEELREIFRRLDTDQDGVITFAEWAESMPLLGINELCRSCLEEGPLYKAALNEEEAQLYENLCSRVRRIMDLAQELGVRVMIDAEWLDIQPAIDHLVVFLQRIYNRGDRPVVFQTYQTYLKGMHGSVLRDLERSKREGWYFGAKVVRGAYMVSEREKALQRGRESPICETYEDTEANFHAAIDSILAHNTEASEQASASAAGPGAAAEGEVLIASHSRGSIEHALKRMGELRKDRSLVHFGQLLGMADHLTFTLGVNGYKAYKYVPYGPIDEVVPYLIRRTQENSTLLGSPGVQEERRMVSREVRRRLFKF
mmetsp:Transcript_105858/g.309644  ORF Transcript_105858/g.309644 Transcript_105858/m.309644 type:complete len:613 (-) Transcript_105858:83-1921(-)